MKLVTERLFLEPINDKYFPEFCEMDMDPDVMHFIRKESQSEDEARQRFLKLQTYMKNHPGYGGFALVEKSTVKMVGIGFLIHIEMNTEYGFEVGYRFLKSAWGKGYATEAAKELIRYGFEDKKLTEIFGTTNPKHAVSQKALQKAGLSEVGTAAYHGGSTLFKITV